MKLYAVIPSGFRRAELDAIVDVLVADKVTTFVVDTGYADPLPYDTGWFAPGGRNVIKDHEQPKNISRWWNRGIQAAADVQTWSLPDEEYVVAVLNDDIVIQRGFVPALADAIMYHDVALAFPDVYGLQRDQDFHQPSAWRMSGYAFALRGSVGIRADESLQWWCGDNDIEWQAFQKGGTVLTAAATLKHLYPNSTTTGPLAEQAGRDRETFKNKWGVYCY